MKKKRDTCFVYEITCPILRSGRIGPGECQEIRVERVIADMDFDGMLYVEMFDIIRRIVLVTSTSLYFKIAGEPLIGLKPLKRDEDVGLFVKALHENGSKIDLYCEYNGYDVMEIIQFDITTKVQPVKTPFEHLSNDDAPSTHDNLEDLKDIVDFEIMSEENVVIPKITTDDPWLNKLVGIDNFIGHMMILHLT
ncbi:hypothetical protein Tco_0282518 [Tanacetum coccineum]